MIMTRSRRLAALGVGLAAVLLIGGTAVLAGLGPPEGRPPADVPAQASPEAPSAERIERILEKLSGAGISTTSAEFSTLAAKYGVGGAVRILAFADASGKSAAQIGAMFDGGKGWGQIRKELGLSITPGIGWIMGGGHGKPPVPKGAAP
jgi:hypothetical protein